MKKKNPAAGAPISIRLADDLKRDLDAAALKLKMDTHQAMRIAMEVGLVHFTRIDHNLADCIVERVAREARAAAALSCAASAPSTSTTHTKKPTQTTPANIVPLPPPPVVATLLHDNIAAETTSAPPVTESRKPVIYTKKPNAKKSS